MNKEFAAKLNGREYRQEITKEECAEAKAYGLVVVFGASDDLMEFRGAIEDEMGAWDGVTAYLTSDGLVENKCEDGCPYFEEKKSNAVELHSIWDRDGYSWVYETAIPHETFEIMDGGDKYCRGIVFALADVGTKQ